MKKLIVLLIMVPLIFMFGCANEEKTLSANKAKYDNAINQVVILENKYLQQEGELSVDEVLLRENLGVIVYSDGQLIQLSYNLDGSNNRPKIEKTYKRYSKDQYKLIDKKELETDENQKYLETNSYSERVAIK